MDDAEANGDMPADGSEEPSQFSVTITSNGDGTFSVSSSDSDEEQGEGGGAEMAKSVAEACQLASEMLQEEAGEDSGGADDDSGSMTGDGMPATGDNAPVSGNAAKKMWTQMASSKTKG